MLLGESTFRREIGGPEGARCALALGALKADEEPVMPFDKPDTGPPLVAAVCWLKLDPC